MEDKKEKTLEEKVDEVLKLNEDLSKENQELKKTNEELQRKIAGLRIDGITKQVETKVPQVEEEIQFDFDL